MKSIKLRDKALYSSLYRDMHYPDLKLNKLHLRPLKEDDKAVILEALMDPRFEGFMGLGAHNEAGNKAYVADALKNNGNPDNKSCVMTVINEGAIIGVIDILIIKDEFDLGGFFFPDYQNSKLSGLIASIMVKTVFDMGLTSRLEASTHINNEQSIYIVENLGFEKIRVDSRFYDDAYTHQIIWLLTQDDFKNSVYYKRYEQDLEFLVSESH